MLAEVGEVNFPPCLAILLGSSTSALHAAIRSTNRQEAREKDDLLHSNLSSDPSKLQTAVRKTKSVGTPAVHLLQVGKHIYTGDSVPDGFYEALLNLKVPEISPTSSPEFLSTSENYRHTIELAKSGLPCPPSLSLKLLIFWSESALMSLTCSPSLLVTTPWQDLLVMHILLLYST